MAAAIDLADNMGNAAAGLHMATMGGLWQAAVMGFCGMQRRGEALRIDPQLPPAWKHVRVPLRFRGARLQSRLPRRKAGVDVGITVENVPRHAAAGRRGAGVPSRRHQLRRARRGTLAGGRRMTLLVAVADAQADRELVASARALAAAARWDAVRSTCASPTARAGQRRPRGPRAERPSTAIPSRRSRGWSAGPTVDAFAFGLSAVRPRPAAGWAT